MEHSQEKRRRPVPVRRRRRRRRHSVGGCLAAVYCRTGCIAVDRRETRRFNAKSYRQQGSQPLNPTYNAVDFRRRFCMSRPLFLRIMDTVQQVDSYFAQKPDATGQMGFLVLQKCSSAILQLAYDVSPDSLDESLRVAESTGRKCLRHFVAAIVQVFGDRYLHQPNAQDVQSLSAEDEARGFPGMLGSLDCMHWF
uniref:Uncharacterized protein n=1 Tax=Hyaloperonospora arabidopsidis (strain Emoy2) TaxID=559515 RepID=M4B3D3_HYAAE